MREGSDFTCVTAADYTEDSLATTTLLGQHEVKLRVNQEFVFVFVVMGFKGTYRADMLDLLGNFFVSVGGWSHFTFDLVACGNSFKLFFVFLLKQIDIIVLYTDWSLMALTTCETVSDELTDCHAAKRCFSLIVPFTAELKV